MSLIQQFDRFGYIYTFEYYLYEKELDYSIIDFINNNSINYFYVCFFDIIRENTNYLVTTDPTNDLHQLITIKKNNICSENNIFTYDDQVIIYYNNYMVSISNKMKLDKIDEQVNFTLEEVATYNETYPNLWSLANKNWTLDLETKIASHYCYNIALSKSGAICNFRILSISNILKATLFKNKNAIYDNINAYMGNFYMNKLFPYLCTITFKGKIIYSRNYVSQ
jgi:hypothetical protein